MKKKKIVAIYPYVQNPNSLSFQADACNAWKRNGGRLKYGIRISLFIQYVIAKLRLTFNITQRSHSAKLIFGGGTPDYSIFPYCFFNEVIPMLWDCWPRYQQRLFASLRRNRIKTVILTSSQVANLVRQKFQTINVIYLPEGIDVTKYKNQRRLVDRGIDLLEFGRSSGNFHNLIVSHNSSIMKNHKYSVGDWIFPDIESFIEGLSDTKIAVAFPRCDTHPNMTGDIETLTQRYWECMLSGCILLGRPPQELLDLIGYNPVICADMKQPHIQIDSILYHLEDYQNLVDLNYKTALKYASWDVRMKHLRKELEILGYDV